MYAKLIDGMLRYAPKKVTVMDTIIYNPTGETLTVLGYYPLTYTDMPEDVPEGYYYESGWQQGADSIIQTWTLVELPPAEPTSDDILNIILGEDVNET